MATQENWWEGSAVVAKPNKAQKVDGGVYVAPTRTPEQIADEKRKEDAAVLAQEAADRAARGEATGLKDTKRSAFESLFKSYEGDARVQKYQKVLPIYDAMLTVASRPNPSKADDNILITQFSKIKDPTTGVLGGEFEASKDVQTLFDKYKTDLQGLYDPETGFVSPQARQQFIRATKDLVASDRTAYTAARGRYSQVAQTQLYGLTPEEVIGEDFANTYAPGVRSKYIALMGGEAETGEKGVPALQVAQGDLISTDRDIEIASLLQGAWQSGKTIDEINALTIQLGTEPLPQSTIDALQSDPNRQIRFTPNRSGMREGADSGMGIGSALASGSIRGLTGNLAEEALAVVSPESAAKLQAAGEFAQQEAPVSSFIGEAIGGVLSPLSRIGPGGTVLGEAVRGGIYGGLYGGGEAAPDAGILERALPAVVGLTTGAGTGALAQRFLGGGGNVAPAVGEPPVGGVMPYFPTGASMAAPAEAIVPPVAGIAPEAVAADAGIMARDEVIDLARKAVSRTPGASEARSKLAEMAKINIEAKAAADRLGIELPIDVLSDNAQLQAISGLTRSEIGSGAQTAFNETVSEFIKRAFDAMDKLDAVTDISQVSADVFNRLDNAQTALSDQASKFRGKVTDAINPSGRVESEKIRSFLGTRIENLGGGKEGIASLSPEEKKLYAIVSKGNPTYALLNEQRDLIGQALEKGTGPWVNTSTARLKEIYGALADDQINFIESSAGKEIADKQRAANTLFRQMYEGREQMQKIFAKDLSGSLAPVMQRAITQGQKGNVQALNNIIDIVPEDMRGQVLTSALFKAAKTTDETFSFTNFANIYRDLRANGAVYKQFAKAVGPEGDKLLTDIYAISRRLSDADKNIPRTGASTQLQLLNSERLLSKILKATGGAAGAAVLANVAGGPMVAAMAAPIAAAAPELFARYGGKYAKSNADKLHNLLSSDSFRDYTLSVATGENTNRSMNKLLIDKRFVQWAKEAGIENAKDFLLEKAPVVLATEATGPETPMAAPTVEMPQ